jgi:hypothetical protein
VTVLTKAALDDWLKAIDAATLTAVDTETNSGTDACATGRYFFVLRSGQSLLYPAGAHCTRFAGSVTA